MKLFQKSRDMPVTGEVDYATWQSILEERKRALEFLSEPVQVVPIKAGDLPLKENDENRLVGIMKTMLSTALCDYNKFNKNDIYDSDTKNAVREWQRVCRMAETGVCDKFTWNRLSEYYLMIFKEK